MITNYCVIILKDYFIKSRIKLRTIMFIETQNPANGQFLKQYKIIDDVQVQQQIEHTHQAFLLWRQTNLASRLDILTQLLEVMEQNKVLCAELITKEMGKPIKFSLAEVEKCMLVCRYYLSHAEQILKPVAQATEFKKSFVTYNPLGIVLAVMPWNFPFWQAFRAIVPNLILGNAVLLKHASIVTGCAQQIEALFNLAGFPAHLFKHLLISSKQVASVIANPHIRGVTLTGSEDAGRQIAKEAGQYLKKVVLELGGNDACIVLADADLQMAAKQILSSRLRNSGQVCVSTKRVIVEKAVHQVLVSHLIEEMKGYQLSNPMQPDSILGPMAREDLRQNIHQQVLQVVAQGGQLLAGGYIPNQEGYYYPATLIDNVSPQSIAYQEELFGPVICVTAVDDVNQAVTFANQTRFGLGASIFSKNAKLAEKLASESIEAGLCYVNMPVTSDPRFPFGGIKDSGFGRELSREGMLEFSNIKTVIIND
jgi:succinate-semialdehyde dehydrogenase/glutarate-semialdehyde dehydrogenase